MKVTLVHTTIKKQYIDYFSQMIYVHFKEISKIKELDHNVKSIKGLLEGKIILLYTQNDLIGYLVYELKNVDGRFMFYINYIYILEKYRSKHLGSLLINHVIKFCKKNEIKFIVLTFDTTNEKLLKFYTTQGFKPDIIKTNYSNHKVYSLFI